MSVGCVLDPQFINVGMLDYHEALALQLAIHAKVAKSEQGPTLILVEHPSVITMGKHADEVNLRFTEDYFRAKNVAVVRTDRGGEVTAHMPGQLVAYPIVKLADSKITPKRFVALLEEAVINTLSRIGISAGTDPDYPGVWVENAKICALGVRIKDRTSMHGLALNVSNSLDLFREIVPCGIAGRGVTTISEMIARTIGTSMVRPVLTEELSRLLLPSIPWLYEPIACNSGKDSLEFKL